LRRERDRRPPAGRLLLLRELGDSALELAYRVLDLLPSRGVRRQFELTLQFRSRQATRFELTNPLGIAGRRCLSRLPLLLFAFFHALGEAGFRVDESFSCITHV
jgi:hypothetical protein